MLLHLLYWKWTLPTTRPHRVIPSPVSVNKRWFTFWRVKAQRKNGTGVRLSWLLRFCTFEFSKHLTSLSAGSFMVLPPEHALYSWFLLTYISGWTLSYVADDAECLWKQTCFSCVLSTSLRTFVCNMIEIRNHCFNIIIQVSLIQLHDRAKPQGVVSPSMFLITELFCYLVLCVSVYECVCVCVCVLSPVLLFATPWTVAHQTLLCMEFSRQEYWLAISYSRGSSWPRDQTRVSCISCIGSEFH